jgi:hypothetical protein
VSTPWPIPFPAPPPALFDFDFQAFFDGVERHVQTSRKIRQQAPLSPSNTISVGQETLSDLRDAPSINIVPRGFKYEGARDMRNGFVPEILWSSWLQLECHCWGDDDASGVSQLNAFSSATELARQVLDALQRQNGGVARVRVEGAEFVQKTDTNRNGRMLVVRAAIETLLARDPPILVPLATATTPGAVISITPTLTSPDGTSTISEGVFVVP